MRFIAASAILASSILAGLVASNASAQTTQIFQEQEGQVVVEIEAAAAIGGWSVSKAIPGYTGTSYYVWDGGQQRNGGSGVLTYQVEITSAGNYQFNWRSRIGGASTTEGNDSFVSLSGAPIAGQHTIGTNVWTKAYFNQLNTWSWNTATKDFDPQPIRQFFTAGKHTIRISGRSPGHGLDRFILFKYEEKPYETAFSPASSSQAATMTALPQSSTTTTTASTTTTTTSTTTTTTSTTTTTTTAPPSSPAGATLELQVAGVAGVPSDADAVVLNMTAVNARAPGFATVYPCGQPRPEASNLNYAAGQTIPNLVIAKPGVGGRVCIYTYAAVDVLADVSGYFPNGSDFTPISNPTRVLDTRNGIGAPVVPVGAGSTSELLVTGVAGVPSNADAVALNMTAVNARSAGFATVYPCGQPRPETSNLNYAAGQTIPNLVIAKPGVGGKVCIYSYSTIDVLADVSGFFPAGSGFTPISNPTRVLDTRNGIGT